MCYSRCETVPVMPRCCRASHALWASLRSSPFVIFSEGVWSSKHRHELLFYGVNHEPTEWAILDEYHDGHGEPRKSTGHISIPCRNKTKD